LALCRVTVTDSAGVSHTLDVMAASRNHAACRFWAEIRSTPSLPQIRFEDDTVYEVRPEGSETVHRVSHRKMLEWANREADRVNRRRPT